MRPEVIPVFGDLSNAEGEERERYYAVHGTPTDVRREVESLFAFDDTRLSLKSLVHEAVGMTFEDRISDGDNCGPYRLLRIIGRGGMGVVYLAERTDGELRQQAAVKLLRSSLDSGEARRRFLQERQILADLAHPNVARLIDAGHRPDGQPYLVMDYIEGRPIDEYCASLPVRDKVALMAPVCEAIAYAHQKLVVHRDLKPGNILVDDGGRPRVLDFGIAKMMDASEATHTMERRLTPDYASPEQAAGGPVTTATDIYSLGAVLYTLLTGRAPVSGKLLPSGDPDLDAIIRKTLRKEPEERYATADRLAGDLRAWLEYRPVSARHGERWYRTRRWMRRHWVPAAAAVIAIGGLIGGLVAARAERDIAQRRFAEVRQLANHLFTIEKDVQSLPGSTAARERIVNTSLQYLERLSKEAGGDWELNLEIAAGYRKAAEAQGVFRGVNLGKPADAEASLRKADALLREVWKARPNDPAVLHDLIETVDLESRIEFGTKRLKALEAKLSEMQNLVASYERLVKDDAAKRLFLGKMYESMALSGRDVSAEMPMEFARRAVALRRASLAEDDSQVSRRNLANALATYARMLRATGDLEQTVMLIEETLTMFEKMAAADPNDYKARLNIANTHASLARNAGDVNGPSLGRTQFAVTHYRESVRLGREVIKLDPRDQLARFNHSLAAWRLGDALRDRDPREALAAYDEAISVVRPLAAKTFTRDLPMASALAESTFALRALHRDAEAAARLREANEIAEAHRGAASAVYQVCREAISRAEADWLVARGRPEEAVARHREWLRAENLDEVKQDFNSAFVASMRYRLLRDALIAAGKQDEAAQAEAKRQEIAALWKSKRPDGEASRILLR